MQPSITIRNLGKEYKLSNTVPYIALRDVISNSMKNIFQPARGKKQSIWALNDINLVIMPGERVGIVGRNGAGKSTLLKVISRITPPTKGDIWIQGRVGSLLEVGTGFHPELTGRENIYFNGSILGLKKSEIDKQLDAIIDFSGVEKFIDSPLKHYSSGMQMRLAFSVAAHLESEILLIDEVLAVGDIEFQRKCLGKMQEVSSQEGRTVLFVSHDISAVSTLTTRSVLLDEGNMIAYGATPEIINQYTALSLREREYVSGAVENQPSVVKVELITSEGNNLQAHGKPMSVSFQIAMPEADVENLALSFQIMNQQQQAVYFNWIFDYEQPFARSKGINVLNFSFEKIRLFKGEYFVRVHLGETKWRKKYQQFDCCSFTVEMIGMPEPEWGWNPGVCQVLEEGTWKIK